MKLVLEQATTWPVEEVVAGATARTTAAGPDDLTVVIHPLEPLQDRWGSWKDRMVAWAVPLGAKAEVGKDDKGQSSLEWPVEIIESTVTGPGGTVVEARITVLYFVLEWCTAVMISGKPERLAAEREQALQLVLSARPDWSRPEVVAIAQLYGD